MRILRSVLAAGLAMTAICMWGQDAASGDAKVARGKYLAEELARCQDCHTPKMDNGNFIKSQWMKGAAISVTPAAPVTGWHATSPDVTPNGTVWKRWGEEGLVNFLTTGKNPRGGSAGPPMPTYMLKREDAEAIVAFLKSLQ
ncbi:MAG: c-type cytochrome [Bryobacteraceae bacterium]